MAKSKFKRGDKVTCKRKPDWRTLDNKLVDGPIKEEILPIESVEERDYYGETRQYLTFKKHPGSLYYSKWFVKEPPSVTA